MDNRPMIDITADWGGGDDGYSIIRMRRSIWRKIQEGAYHERGAYSWYEGKRYPCRWVFSEGMVSITGPDDEDYLVEEPIGELIVEEDED